MDGVMKGGRGVEKEIQNPQPLIRDRQRCFRDWILHTTRVRGITR